MPFVGFRAHADIFDLLFFLAGELNLVFKEQVVLKSYSEELIYLNSYRLTLVDGLGLGG